MSHSRTNSIKVAASVGSTSSPVHKLRPMYQRAARAFLQRNTRETQQLIDEAFTIITPPSSEPVIPDPLASQRKKWDILRITLETTMYASPSQPKTTSPSRKSQRSPSPSYDIRSNLLLSPPSLLATLHTRSLKLFTPAGHMLSPRYLPSQILISLALASLKLECPQVGKGMVEEWLARRITPETPAPEEGYAKVLDVYCLHILPRLGGWDYASEFIRYEAELPHERRQRISETLQLLRIQSQTPPSPPPSYQIASSSRASSSERDDARPLSRSSSASSASNLTAVPRTPRPPNGMTSIPNGKADDEVRSSSRASTVRPLNPKTTPTTTNLTHVLQVSSSSSSTAVEDSPLAVKATEPASLMNRWHHYSALLRIHYFPLLRSKVPFFICFVLPILAMVASVRRRTRRGLTDGRRRSPTAEQLRRTLEAKRHPGTVMAVWNYVAGSVKDAVVMAGSGLV